MSEMFPDEKRAANIVFKEKKLEKAEEDFENRFSGKEFVGGFEEKGKEGHKKYKESEISKAFSDDVRVGLEMGEVKYNEAGLKRMKKV